MSASDIRLDQTRLARILRWILVALFGPRAGCHALGHDMHWATSRKGTSGGLMNPDEFERRAGGPWRRASGRTTRMLLRALVAMAQGRAVALAGHNFYYGQQLTARLHDWAQRLDLDRKLICRPAYALEDAISRENYWRGRGQTDLPDVFEDHHGGPPRAPGTTRPQHPCYPEGR